MFFWSSFQIFDVFLLLDTGLTTAVHKGDYRMFGPLIGSQFVISI